MLIDLNNRFSAANNPKRILALNSIHCPAKFDVGIRYVHYYNKQNIMVELVGRTKDNQPVRFLASHLNGVWSEWKEQQLHNIQSGTAVASIQGMLSNLQIWFDTPFTAVPKIIASFSRDTNNNHMGAIAINIRNKTTSGFIISLEAEHSTDLGDIPIDWIAVAE